MLTQLASEFGVFKRRACHLPGQRRLVPGEAASAAEGTWLPLPPEVAQRLPGNAAGTVEKGTHRVEFSERGEITPLGATKAWALAGKQHACWCRDICKPGQPSSSLCCPKDEEGVWEEVWAQKWCGQRRILGWGHYWITQLSPVPMLWLHGPIPPFDEAIVKQGRVWDGLEFNSQVLQTSGTPPWPQRCFHEGEGGYGCFLRVELPCLLLLWWNLLLLPPPDCWPSPPSLPPHQAQQHKYFWKCSDKHCISKGRNNSHW